MSKPFKYEEKYKQLKKYIKNPRCGSAANFNRDPPLHQFLCHRGCPDTTWPPEKSLMRPCEVFGSPLVDAIGSHASGKLEIICLKTPERKKGELNPPPSPFDPLAGTKVHLLPRVFLPTKGTV